MPNDTKATFLTEIQKRFGHLRKLENSNSLYEVGNGVVRIYIRYSKVHRRSSTFYGLRKEDLQALQGHPSLICFLWPGQVEPLFIDYADYEDIFQSLRPAGDGQFKAQIYLHDEATELFLAKAGRFNLEGQFGWNQLEVMLSTAGSELVPVLSHSQVQTLLSAIGTMKGYDIWIPLNNRCFVDSSLCSNLDFRGRFPAGFEAIADIIEEVDVVWIDRGSSRITGLFEVEHSTPVYSALLRFNDIHLTLPSPHQIFRIVANDVPQQWFE